MLFRLVKVRSSFASRSETMAAVKSEEELLNDLLERMFPEKNVPASLAPSPVPYNPYFPNCNQSKNCWVNYVAWRQCLSAFDSTPSSPAPDCVTFWQRFRPLCNNEWVRSLALLAVCSLLITSYA